MITLEPEANGCIREVACFKEALNVWSYHLGPEPNGRDKEMAALHSDHYTQVQLYTYMHIVHVNTHTAQLHTLCTKSAAAVLSIGASFWEVEGRLAEN